VDKPFVSVIIAAYMAEDTLARAVHSLQAQSFVNWEAIIIDDYSQDNTFNVANSTTSSDSRFKVIKLDQNCGPSVARNEGLKLASGEWVAILDADDAYLPTRLANFVKFARQYNFGMIVDNMSDLVKEISTKNNYWPHWSDYDVEIPLLEMLKGCANLYPNHYGLLKPFIKKSEIISRHIFYDEELRRGEDVNFCLRLMLSGVRVGRVSSVGYLYDRPEATNVTNASRKNLFHSHLGTKKIKDQYWQKLSSKERCWLDIRLSQTIVSDDIAAYGEARRERKYISMILLLINSKSVRKRFLKATLPLRFYRKIYHIKSN